MALERFDCLTTNPCDNSFFAPAPSERNKSVCCSSFVIGDSPRHGSSRMPQPTSNVEPRRPPFQPLAQSTNLQLLTDRLGRLQMMLERRQYLFEMSDQRRTSRRRKECGANRLDSRAVKSDLVLRISLIELRAFERQEFRQGGAMLDRRRCTRIGQHRQHFAFYRQVIRGLPDTDVIFRDVLSQLAS